MRSPDRGFTLIEMVVGIVLLAIALTTILGLLINQAPRAIDPVQQLRAAQLAERLLGEVMQRSFDEHSDHNSGSYRCGETVDSVTYDACTAQANYGPDSGETAPYLYNDVDDFDTAGQWRAANLYVQQSSLGTQESDYRNFSVRIAVTPVDISSGDMSATCSDPCSIGKRIALSIRLPDKSELDFATYRGNY